MRFRAHAIGGVLDLERVPEGGTLVRCRFDPEVSTAGDGASEDVLVGD
jgi:nitrate/nitrite-specific signal transduction histidine kinase